MTVRRPLVLVDGQLKELPAGDAVRGALMVSYDDRANLRSMAGDDLLTWVLVEGLGWFQHFVGADEGPDDDEMAFQTATGYWLLMCPSWDVIDAYKQVGIDQTGAALAARVLKSIVTKTAVSVSTNNSTTFTVDVVGAKVGAAVVVTPPSNPTRNTITLSAYVSAQNVVTVYVGNSSVVAAGGFSAGDWTVVVITN